MIIALEGSDQAGKKTQTVMLSKALKAQKIKTAVFDFPDYSTIIGKEINNYLRGKRKFPPEIIHYLYAANRWEKLEEIKKSTVRNSVLIMNRYYHSNLVYGIANGLKEKWLQKLEEGLPKADLVIVLDASQNDSFLRKKSKRDRFEKNKDFSKNFDMDEYVILLHYHQQFVITCIWKTFSISVRGYKIKMVVWTYGDVSNSSHST